MRESEYVFEGGFFTGFMFGFRTYYYEDITYYTLYIGPICLSLNRYK